MYYAEFARDIKATSYNKVARKAALLRGLSDELNNALVIINLKNLSFAELVSTYTRVDSRLRSNAHSRRNDGAIRPNYTPRAPV